MLKASERLLFSLLIINQNCTPNVCLTYVCLTPVFNVCVQNNRQAAFQFIKLSSVIQKRVFKTSGAAFAIRKMLFKQSQETVPVSCDCLK